MARKEPFEYLWTDKKRSIFGLPLTFTRYFITENKFICRTGLLNITEKEIDLYKVMDKQLILPLKQRIFGCGTVHLSSRDRDMAEFDIYNIKKPRNVLDLLDRLITAQRDRYNIRGRDMMGVSLHPGFYSHDEYDHDADSGYDYDHDADQDFDGDGYPG